MESVRETDCSLTWLSSGFNKSLPFSYFSYTTSYLDSLRQSHPSISLLFLNTVVKNILVSLHSEEKKPWMNNLPCSLRISVLLGSHIYRWNKSSFKSLFTLSSKNSDNSNIRALTLQISCSRKSYINYWSMKTDQNSELKNRIKPNSFYPWEYMRSQFSTENCWTSRSTTSQPPIISSAFCRDLHYFMANK